LRIATGTKELVHDDAIRSELNNITGGQLEFSNTPYINTVIRILNAMITVVIMVAGNRILAAAIITAITVVVPAVNSSRDNRNRDNRNEPRQSQPGF
jgi:hypothetical protein